MRVIAEYGLHVRPSSGEELRFPEIPVPLSYERHWVIGMWVDRLFLYMHHVRVLQADDGQLIEETTIPSIKTNGGEYIICPRPHGRGWTLHDGSSDKQEIFRRPAPEPSAQRRLTLGEFEDERRAARATSP